MHDYVTIPPWLMRTYVEIVIQNNHTIVPALLRIEPSIEYNTTNKRAEPWQDPATPRSSLLGLYSHSKR